MLMARVRAIGLVEPVERAIAVDSSPWTLIFADILAPALRNHDGAVKAEAQTAIADHLKRVPPGSTARTRVVVADRHLLALADAQTCRLYTPGAAQEDFLQKLSGWE